jgi:hypothetical protein
MKAKLQVEIGHVLFMDVVGYSKLSVDEQHEIQHQLTEIVGRTEQYRDMGSELRAVRIFSSVSTHDGQLGRDHNERAGFCIGL